MFSDPRIGHNVRFRLERDPPGGGREEGGLEAPGAARPQTPIPGLVWHDGLRGAGAGGQAGERLHLLTDDCRYIPARLFVINRFAFHFFMFC